jgi:hypothetical protein
MSEAASYLPLHPLQRGTALPSRERVHLILNTKIE